MFARIEFVNRNGRMHAVVFGDNGARLACAAISTDDFGQLGAEGYFMTMPLFPAARCGHGGTYREPRPWSDG